MNEELANLVRASVRAEGLAHEPIRPALWEAAYQLGYPERSLDQCLGDENNQKGAGDMLILSRKVGEALKIGQEVTIKVLSRTGNQVKLGIAAPKSVAVHREEIFDRIQSEQKKTSAD